MGGWLAPPALLVGGWLAPPALLVGGWLAPPPLLFGGGWFAPPALLVGGWLAPPPLLFGGGWFAPPALLVGGWLAPPPLLFGGGWFAPPALLVGGWLAPPPLLFGGGWFAPPPLLFGGGLPPTPATPASSDGSAMCRVGFPDGVAGAVLGTFGSTGRVSRTTCLATSALIAREERSRRAAADAFFSRGVCVIEIRGGTSGAAASTSPEIASGASLKAIVSTKFGSGTERLDTVRRGIGNATAASSPARTRSPIGGFASPRECR